MTSIHKHPRLVTLGYAAPGAAIKALTLPLLSYLPPFYAQRPGASLAAVGLLFMAARFWDILIDPLVGYAMDRSRPPLGRRRFWIAVATVLLLLTTWPVFHPPSGWSFPAIAGLLFLFYLGWTVLMIGHAAWPAELTTDRPTRLRLIGWREWAGVVGMIAVLIAPVLLTRSAKPPLDVQVGLMGAFVCVLLSLTIIPALVVVPRGQIMPGARPRLMESFVLLRASSALRRLLAADLLSGSGYAVNSATSFFIVSDHLAIGSSYPQVMIAFMAGMLVGVPALMRLSVKRGRKTGFAVAMIGSALASLAFAILPSGAPIPAMIVNALLGFFTGGYQLNLNSAMVDLADADRMASGRDRVSLHLAVLAMTNKVGYALAIGIVYGGLALFGYRAGQAEGLPVIALMALGTALPAALFVAAALQMSAFSRGLIPTGSNRTKGGPSQSLMGRQ
jgi:glycoside/pentoside/hexuronide:cation symporter, GPH family